MHGQRRLEEEEPEVVTWASTKPTSAMGRFVLVIAVSMALCAILMESDAQAADLVTSPVNRGNRLVLKGQSPAWAVARNSDGIVPGDTIFDHLTLILKRSPERQKAFEKFLQELQRPASHNYHRFLTPVEVGKRFGASKNDTDAVSTWLRSEGLHVNSVSNSRIMIDFGGEASVVETAFATEMHYYLVNGERRMATTADPAIPAALAGVIRLVRGLNTVNDHPYHGTAQGEVPAVERVRIARAFSLQ